MIEAAAEHLAQYILKEFTLIKSVKLILKKPWAPIGRPLDYAAVEIERAWHKAYLGVGTNMGHKQANVDEAIKLINASGNTKVTKISKMYETKPVGYLEQDDFLNCALEINTLLSPKELVRFLLEVEKGLKRERVIKWGPRTIDLDVLLYDNIISEDEEIIIPHPRMHERLFVMEPLCDIAANVIHPILMKRNYEIKEDIFE